MYRVFENGWSDATALEGRWFGDGGTSEAAVKNAAARTIRAKSYGIRFQMNHGLWSRKVRSHGAIDSFRNNWKFERVVTGEELRRLAARLQ